MNDSSCSLLCAHWWFTGGLSGIVARELWEQSLAKRLKRKKQAEKKMKLGHGSRSTPTRPEEATRGKKKMYKRRDFCFKCHASVLGKCTTSDASFSIQKHGSFCLQKQKCFIIRSLLLTQNLNVNSYLKLLLPGTVLLKWTPDFSNSSPYRKKQLKWVKKRRKK